MESSLVEKLSTMHGYVIAAGGGAIVNSKNLALMKKSGTVISLTADLETILARVGSAEDRPMLHGEDLRKRATVLLKERAKAYAQADIMLDTSNLTVDEAARQILVSLEQNTGRD
jgi:shikimate kinase